MCVVSESSFPVSFLLDCCNNSSISELCTFSTMLTTGNVTKEINVLDSHGISLFVAQLLYSLGR